MWGICPSGDPGHGTCGCASFFDEPFANPGPWTGDPVRIRIEWGGGRSRLLRDGIEVVSVDWTGFDFGPSELHMMLGSPRNDGGLSALPIGATFSDLVVDGDEGPLATCGGAAIDAGTPVDAGSCDGMRDVVQDTTAAIFEPGPFPDPSDLNVEGDPGAPAAIVYLRFPPVPAGSIVTSATLTMTTQSTASANGGSGDVCRVDDATWDEATLTWSHRPAISTACTTSAHAVTPNEMVTWDVTALIAPSGPIDLAIVSADPDGTHYLSRESGGCANGPRLDLTLAPAPDAGSLDAGIDAGADAATTSIDSGHDASTRGSALSSGCGCGVAHTHAPRVAWLALLLLVRRRQPRIIDSSSKRPSR